MNAERIKEILDLHQKWLIDSRSGEKANLSGANLSGLDLSNANLRWANLIGSDLSGADLRWANLSWANLSWANLSEADLRWANLSNANLRRADLRRADLRGADLIDANLIDANLIDANLIDANLKIFQAGLWTAYIQKDSIRIGGQNHSIGEWEAFSDSSIAEMHKEALAWWKENKAIVLGIARSMAPK